MDGADEKKSQMIKSILSLSTQRTKGNARKQHKNQLKTKTQKPSILYVFQQLQRIMHI